MNPNSSGLSPTSSDPQEVADETLRQRRDAMYTPLAIALEELQKRRQLFGKKTPGRDWLPDDLPKHPNGYAFLARFIATPNLEAHRFLDLVNGTDLLPAIAEFNHDKFVAQNPLKCALARMGFHNGFNRHGQPLVEFVNVMNSSQQGRPLKDLQTFWGQSLIAFHHELLAHTLNGGVHPVVFDSSPQYFRAGGTAAAYYRKFLLPLCVANCIVFEDYLLDGKELSFTHDVVLPAFDAVTVEWGIKPLIVRLSPSGEEVSPDWFWYPGELKSFVLERLHKTTGGSLQDKINALHGR